MHSRGIIQREVPIPPDFPTNFPLTENPISQSNKWLLGGVDGLDWHNQQTVTGKTFGTSFAHDGGISDYDDNLAVLKTSYRTYANNQFAEGITYRAGGYAPTINHETELLLRFALTAHSATGYEILWSYDGWIVIVRWNGALGDYTELESTGAPIAGDAADGDVIRAEITGNIITCKKNGSTVLTTDITHLGGVTYSSGQPGHGSWSRNNGTTVLANLGWKQWNAGDLP